MITTLAVSQIGPGHLYANLPNQDAGRAGQKGRYWAVAVADGLGSKQFSDVGAKLAVELFWAMFRHCPDMKVGREFINSLYLDWVGSLSNLGIDVDSAATTFLCSWGDSEGNFQYVQIGDGLICSTSQIYSPVIQVQYSNITSCLNGAFSNKNWYLGQGKLLDNDALFLMTDGISEDLLEPREFVIEVRKYVRNRSKRRIKSWLKNELKNWATPHHTDDKTVAMIIKYD